MLAVVSALAQELGGRPGARPVALGENIERDLGLGSLERVELLLRLEQRLGVRLADAVMTEAASPADLVAAILEAGPALPEGPPVARPRVAAGRGAPATAGSLLDVLAWHAEQEPERVHVILREDDGRERPISYGALWDGARAVAGALCDRRLGGGERVAIMLRTEAAFFESFFGVLLAGAVPVPIYPPHPRDLIEEYARRQVGILRNAEPRALITFAEAKPVATMLRSRVMSLRHVVEADDVRAGGAALGGARAAPGDPALIQYTSGSTGDPKGVLLSHANLLANIRAIGEAIDVRPDDVAVSWLPLYHDMGLIGCWLGALYFGLPIAIMSPLAFLARPARWLQAIHAHRATLSAAPNFAFDLCARRIAADEIEGLELSSWRLALNGSEAVSAETIERFTARFSAHGFRAETMCPVYGLAEVSVALTAPALGAAPRIDRVRRPAFEGRDRAEPAPAEDPTALRFVSCGRPVPGHQVRIVDRDRRPLGPRVQGRIEFRGPSVTAGYFRNDAATSAALHDGWMDSGDLGYWAEGDLFVTGRIKDLIIKAGRNLYPQEIEELVGSIPGIRRGCVAAFGAPDPALGTERLIVIAETRQEDRAQRERLHDAVVDRVVGALGIPPDAVVVAPPGTVLKTSSGKIRRSATREAYVRGRLERRRASARVQWARVLVPAVGGWARHAMIGAADLAKAGYLAALLAVTVPPLWLLLLLAPSGRASDRVVRLWCRVILALAGCDVRVEGAALLHGRGPAVLAVNHASYLDVVVLLASLSIDFRFVAKRELESVPLIGRVIRTVGHLTVERARVSQSVTDAERVTTALRRGQSVLVFPEGTFVRSPGILPFRLGAFKSAVETGCPVIPIAIRGTREILPADDWLPRPGPVTVAVGAPLMPAADGWPAMVRLRDLTRAEIARRAGETPIERG